MTRLCCSTERGSVPKQRHLQPGGPVGAAHIAPLLDLLPTKFKVNSMYIAPLFADTMNVTFTPYNGGKHSS